MVDRALSMISLAMRAGKLANGEFQVLEAIRAGKAKLVILAENASDNTGKKFKDKCRYYEVPILVYSTKEELGRSLGKEERAVVAVNDEGLASSIKDKITTKGI